MNRSRDMEVEYTQDGQKRGMSAFGGFECDSPIREIIGHDADDNAIYEQHLIVMQFTGLLDCQGKEIFEGDILHDTADLNAAVEWDGKNACFKTKYDTPMIFSHREVIGNIYENPDLLPKAA